MLWSLLNRSGAMNARIRASSFTSILRSSVASVRLGTASLGDIPARSIVTLASVGSSSTSASTTPRGRLRSVRANQRKESAVAFLEAAVAYFAKLGIRVERVMTDNGSCYRSKTFRTACKRFGLRQIFTRPSLRRPTEKLNASFKPRFANGPTPAPIKTRISDRPSC